MAVSGRESTHDYLRSLGANRILGRDEFAESRPLEKQLWAGAIDTVGDKVLAKVLAQIELRRLRCGLWFWRAASHSPPRSCRLFCVMSACRAWIP